MYMYLLSPSHSVLDVRINHANGATETQSS